jgi:histone demethylase JARID1
LPNFQRYADSVKETWFPKNSGGPAEIERAYWHIVESGDRHVCVPYGSDIDTTEYGSGFPLATSSDPLVWGVVVHQASERASSFSLNQLLLRYSKFGWNLNILPGLPQSLLKHVSGISGLVS